MLEPVVVPFLGQFVHPCEPLHTSSKPNDDLILEIKTIRVQLLGLTQPPLVTSATCYSPSPSRCEGVGPSMGVPSHCKGVGPSTGGSIEGCAYRKMGSVCVNMDGLLKEYEMWLRTAHKINWYTSVKYC